MGAEAGTANWIFFLSLGSPSTSVDTEGSMALDPGALTPSGEEEVAAENHYNLPGGTSHCWVVPLPKTCLPSPASLLHTLTPSSSLSKNTKLNRLSLFHLLSSFPLQQLLIFSSTSLVLPLSLLLSFPSLTTCAARVNEACS